MRAGSVVALCGGVGGAKLALGLSRVLAKNALTVIVNTADDFEHLGLYISPDLDTVLYTLSGLVDPERGWGRAGETWRCLQTVIELGGEGWFKLGDSDLALHMLRSQWLKSGRTLSEFTESVARRLGIAARIVPMTDEPMRTLVQTSVGSLPFQRYFVEQRCEPMVESIVFDGAEAARPAPQASAALACPGLAAVIICPSNPYLSIDPILGVPGMRRALGATAAPVVAVSPITGGIAVKGPTAKIMGELGLKANSASIAAHYHDVIDGLLINEADAAEAPQIACHVETAPTLMRDLHDKEILAQQVLAFAQRIAASANRTAEPGASAANG